MSTNNTNELIKSTRNEYYRNYRRKNKDKIKKIQDKYWEQKALKRLMKGAKNEI